MIRILNIIALALTVTFSFGLYKLKYNTSVAVDNVSSLQNEIEVEEQFLRVLRAEWSHLNRAERIQKLSEKYLNLEPVNSDQIAFVTDIPMRPLLADRESPLASRMGGPLIMHFDESLNSNVATLRPRRKPEDITRGGKANG